MKKIILASIISSILTACVGITQQETRQINPACIGRGSGNKFSPIHTIHIRHVLKDGVIISYARTHQGNYSMLAFVKADGTKGNIVDGQEVPINENSCLAKTGTYQYKAKSTDTQLTTIEKWEVVNRYLDEPKAEKTK